MDIFDNIGKTITDVGGSTVKKSKEIAGIVKNDFKAADEERKRFKLFCDLGKLYFEKHSEDFDEDFAAIISQIKESIETQKKFEAEAEELKKGKEEPKAENVEAEVVDDDDDAIRFCTECGAELVPGTDICVVCGAPVRR